MLCIWLNSNKVNLNVTVEITWQMMGAPRCANAKRGTPQGSLGLRHPHHCCVHASDGRGPLAPSESTTGVNAREWRRGNHGTTSQGHMS